MFSNVFVLSKDDYVRNIDPIGQYIQQSANFLSKQTGRNIEDCIMFVTNKIKNKEFPNMCDRVVTYLERNEFGDREKKEITLSNYITSSLKEREIIAPTFTTYLHPDVKTSVTVQYVKNNIKYRSVAKKAQFKHEAEGNVVLGYRYNKEQVNRKLKNNSMSGAFVNPHNALFNKTAHSTLTSNCRLIASMGNANNEKIITGNRHYWSPDIALNNIVSIISNVDYSTINEMFNKYNLYKPTVEDAIECITYSTNLYWTNDKAITEIRTFLSKLSYLELAAFIYVGDLYHIKKHNDVLIRTFITELSKKVCTDLNDSLSIVKKLDESCLILGHQICMAEVKGKGKAYEKFDKKSLDTLVATTLNIQDTLTKYSDLIRTFFTTTNIPSSVAYIAQSLRRTVVTSDTDSTIFTVQDWVKWYTGKYNIDDESIAVAGSIVFFASQTITHALAVLSVNMGFTKENLHTMAMKSEYFWPVFVNTSVAKHYFALCEIREGDVFAKYKKEIKGIHLKSSNSPKQIMNKAESLMDHIMRTVANNQKISLAAILKDIANFERGIVDGILNGNQEFFRSGKIKSPESYNKISEESPYQHYLLWNNVFAPRYGNISEPPFGVIKIPTTISNVTKLSSWLESINDLELRDRLAKWLLAFKKTSLPTMYLSIDYVISNGIPEEIRPIIDTRRAILDLCNVFYMILESLGYYLKEGHIISDFY